jgi:hypothetical protein
MADQNHINILNQGVEAWNDWREKNPEINPDLSGMNFRNADLILANLSNANLNGANLREADLRWANLKNAKLRGIDLGLSNLNNAQFINADLTEANLFKSSLVQTNFEGAILVKCNVYGISTWDTNLRRAEQKDIIITPHGFPEITVDNLEVAQFIYLILHNEKIRDVIDTIGKKGVLILGRFIAERKSVLDAIREKLRKLGYIPIVFDFERSKDRDFTETIMILAGMCLFIIADITNPKSSPLELQATVPNYMIPFVPIIKEGEKPFAMFEDLKGKYEWVLDILVYDSIPNLIEGFENAVLDPALEKHSQLMARKSEELRVRHIRDYKLKKK